MTTSNSSRDSTPSNDPNNAASSGSSSTASAPDERSGAGAAPRIIKRYSNRKLYDTVESRYVTLPQIAQLLRKGEDVRIIDNNSKEDLTSVTLAQILYEEERKQSRALPLGALKDLIHTSGEKLMSSLREGPMGKFIGPKPAEGGAEEQTPPSAPAASTSTAPAAAPDASGKDAAGSKGLSGMIEQSRGAIEEWQHRVDERVRKVFESLSPSSQVEKLQAEVKRLAQRLEELENRLAARSGKKDNEKE